MNLVDKLFSRKGLALFFLTISFLSLDVAFFIQYVLKVKPCNLCFIGRYPYYASIAITALLYFVSRLSKNTKLYMKLTVAVNFILFVASFAISLFHTLVVKGIVQYSCSGGGGISKMTLAEYKEYILNREHVSCMDVFKIMNIDLPMLVLIFSAVLSFACIFLYRHISKMESGYSF